MRKLICLVILFSIFLNGVSFSHNSSEEYTILTSKSLFNGAVLFKSLRQSQYDVKLLFVENIGKTPQEIKSFLEKNVDGGFLLIIGDETVVPKGILHPKVSNEATVLPSEVKSDNYYSMLGEDLDKDRDGFEGELFDDRISYEGKLFVGRIPFNDLSRIKIVYDNISHFEKNQSNKVLFAGSFISFPNEEYYGSRIFNGDGAREMEVLREFFPDAVSMYEKEGSFPSSFVCDLPLNKENFIEEIKNSGLVFWSGHGSKKGSYRCIWDDKNTNGIPDEPYSFPSFITSTDSFRTNAVVFSGSCLNLNDKDNLGEAFLLNGSPAFIGSTEVSFTPSYFSSPLDGGNGTLEYYFARNLRNGFPVGASLTKAMNEFYKRALFSDIEDPPEAGISIIYSTNLIGDPALCFNYREGNIKKSNLKEPFNENLVIDSKMNKDFEIHIWFQSALLTSKSFFVKFPEQFLIENVSPDSSIYDSLNNFIRCNDANEVIIKGKIRGKVSSSITVFNDTNERIYQVSSSGYDVCDVDFNGKVERKDFEEMVISFGHTYMDKDFNFVCDLNRDHRVDGRDIFLFLFKKGLP